MFYLLSTFVVLCLIFRLFSNFLLLVSHGCMSMSDMLTCGYGWYVINLCEHYRFRVLIDDRILLPLLSLPAPRSTKCPWLINVRWVIMA